MNSSDAIERIIVNVLARILGVEAASIDVREPLENFSIDSLTAMDVVGDLEEKLGRPLAPTVMFDYPNIELLAAHLAEEG